MTLAPDAYSNFHQGWPHWYTLLPHALVYPHAQRTESQRGVSWHRTDASTYEQQAQECDQMEL